PGLTARLSWVTDAISVRGSPRSSSTSTVSRSSWSSSTRLLRPYLPDWPGAGVDRPSPRPRVSPCSAGFAPSPVEDVAPGERDAVVGVVDFPGLPVVVVVVLDVAAELFDFGRVVVVVDDGDDDFDGDDRGAVAVVVVVDDFDV